MVKIDLITGFLGSGKTTFIRKYAQYLMAGDKTKALLTFWVLKEAQVKLTGQGLRGFPNGTHFSLEDPRVWEWDGCLLGMIVE